MYIVGVVFFLIEMLYVFKVSVYRMYTMWTIFLLSMSILFQYYSIITLVLLRNIVKLTFKYHHVFHVV
jgi:hypothetical protein